MMMMELDAELDSFGRRDADEPPPVGGEIASGGPHDTVDAFDGWDGCNWYWDNDFDCISASDDSPPAEMISVVICSDDEMTGSVDNGDGDDCLKEMEEPFFASPLTDGHGAYRDLSNEEYLLQFERKFCQPADLGGYNISSVSSSMNSSSDSSLYIVTQAERSDEFWLNEQHTELDDGDQPPPPPPPPPPKKPASDADDVAAVAGCRMSSSAGHRVPSLDDGEDVENAFPAQHLQHRIQKQRTPEFVGTVRENKEMKEKAKKKTSSSPTVSGFCKTEKRLFVESEGAGRSDSAVEEQRGSWRRKKDDFPSSDSPNIEDSRSKRSNVLTVFSFAAGLGLISGLFLGFLTARYITSTANIGSDIEANDCPRRVCQDRHRIILNSVWATKYEELVMENVDLHLQLREVREKFSLELFQAQHLVAYLRSEFSALRDDFGELERSSEDAAAEATAAAATAECRLFVDSGNDASPPPSPDSAADSLLPLSS